MAREVRFAERTSRRMHILAGRMRRSPPGMGPRHRSVFFHLPKCGGTSVAEAMYATVPFSQRIGVLDAVSTRRAAAMAIHGRDDPFLCHEDLPNGQQVFDLREQLQLQHMAWDTWLIHGHVLHSEMAMKAFGDLYRYVTLMRDPVERMISNFGMAQRTGVFPGEIDDYLESGVARSHSQVFLRYLYGQNAISDDQIPQAVDIAKERLSMFALIGFLDDLDGFSRRYRDIFGVTLKIRRLNAAPGKRPEIGDAQRARIAEMCAPDTEIYRHARALA